MASVVVERVVSRMRKNTRAQKPATFVEAPVIEPETIIIRVLPWREPKHVPEYAARFLRRPYSKRGRRKRVSRRRGGLRTLAATMD